ncbi:Transthyretin-like family and Immunoglobulin-like fold domain-containing protein [Strongyloides ratti]|uniref:Transthyretin-like family and Immunoglobulin-like fold domain-containing protein n=1 Tax=Strongyloides ratti TaxID=34506 RepID=A0A090N0P6_STRRB|nr:Transthyretin-like family and Immunoglobulin-like fold domain-containing protein [Strongyloides ratti]CEF71053.1 Transthyretin-like family and Immunoglobulin-like fold domain-containing protein [Strongyloides ratti]
MQHKRNYFLTLFVIITILFSYLNCDAQQSGNSQDEDGDRYFVGKGNVTCNDKGKQGVNVTIYKKNEDNNGLDVLNFTLTDTNGYFNIEGHWTKSNETNTKICFKGSCSKGRKKRVVKKKNNQLCFYFPFKNITKTKDEAEKNPYVVSVPLDYSSQKSKQ